MKTSRKSGFLTIWLLAGLLAVSTAAAQKDDQAEVLMQAAQQKQLVEGQLEEAIQLYKRIVQEHPGSRVAAAKALLEMGRCYEKLGNTEARKAYERLVRDYGDQNEAAAQARARLAALTGNVASSSSEMVTRRVWASPGEYILGSVSPDGRYLTYANWATLQGNLVLRDLATGTTHDLTSKTQTGAAAYFSAISPNGREVAYTWLTESTGELRVVGLDGSAPRTLFSNKEVGALPMDWSPDGKYVLSTLLRTTGQFQSQIALISAADGSVRVLKTFDWMFPGKMRFSPDGRYIAYDYPPRRDSESRDIFLMATDGSRVVPLVEHPAEDQLLGWTPDGNHILFASERSGSMSAWILHMAEGKPQGPPELVKQDIGPAQPIGFTRGGSYYYGLAIGANDVYTAEFDAATGRVVTEPQKATQRFVGSNHSPAWSPDGRFLAYISERNLGLFPHGVISIHSLNTGEERDLSLDLLDVWEPIRWSPDGHSILLPGKDKKIQHGFFAMDVQTGEVTPLLRPGQDWDASNPAWFPEGKRLLYIRNSREAGKTVFAVVVRELATGRETELFRAATGAWIYDVALSPDGQQVALSMMERETKSTALKVLPVTGGESSELVRTKEPDAIYRATLSWSADSRYIVFGKGRLADPERKTQLLAISSRGGESHPLGVVMDTGRNLSFDPTGHRVAFAAGRAKSEIWVMENFLPALKPARPQPR
jgi:Tol biopolymer transport system component